MGKHKDDRHRVSLSATMSRVWRGEDDLSDWDDEELQRGKRRRNGRFYGPDPKILPRAIVDELNRRAFQHAYSVVRNDVEDAVRLWGTIVRDPEADPTLRFEASKEIANRVLGKPRAAVDVDVEVSTREPWQVALISAIVGDLDESDVVDAEVVEGEGE